MADHLDYTFQFRISGIELGDDARHRIANEIATAATRAIVAEDPDEVTGEMWSQHRVNGGRLLLERQALEVSRAIAERAPELLAFDQE